MDDSTDPESRVAYVEALEETTGRSIAGSRTYALNDEAISPIKTTPPSARPAPDSPPSGTSGSSSARVSDIADSDSGASSPKGARLALASSKAKENLARRVSQPKDDRRVRIERRPREGGEPQSRDASVGPRREMPNSRKPRPHPMGHANTMSHVPQLGQPRRISGDAPPMYAQPPPAATHGRPRATSRPYSFHEGQPPPSGQGYPPIAYPRGMPPPNHPYPYAYSPQPPPNAGPPPPMINGPGFYDMAPPMEPPNESLRRRFDSGPVSPMQPPETSPIYGPPEVSGPRIIRRPSENRRHEQDRQRMPPPEHIPRRASTTLPSHPAPFQPPPGGPPANGRPVRTRAPSYHRRSVDLDYEYDYYVADNEVFDDVPPQHYDARYTEVARPRRGSTVYEDTVRMPTGRRSSVYGSAVAREQLGLERTYTSGEDKYKRAMAYQDEVTGGPQLPLTAESLRAVKRSGPSSRSTRSSESRDDSDYRRSHSTAITGASSVGLDHAVTIQVNSDGSFDIRNGEGRTITVTHPPGVSQGGSERGASKYRQIEDGRGRIEHQVLPHRTRASSRSDSYSRGYTHNAYPGYDQYRAI